MTAPPASHLRALGERLDRDGRVEFNNGAIVSVVDDIDLIVTWPGSSQTRRVNRAALDQLSAAYWWAMRPPPKIARRPRRQPRHRDWGPCPF